MNQATKWDVAMVHFTDFITHLPSAPSEEDIERYHSILTLFECACARDLSQFRISERHVRHIMNPLPAWQTKHPGRVQREYFLTQIAQLARYLRTHLTVDLPEPSDFRLH